MIMLDPLLTESEGLFGELNHYRGLSLLAQVNIKLKASNTELQKKSMSVIISTDAQHSLKLSQAQSAMLSRPVDEDQKNYET
jgi:hypothetical protein